MRMPSTGNPKAKSVLVHGEKIRVPVFGDPRRHDNWINHPLYEDRISLLDAVAADECDGWQVVLPGSDRPWCVAYFPWGASMSDIGPHTLSPARPWMLVSPPGHDSRLYVYPSLQEAVDAVLRADDPRPRGSLASRRQPMLFDDLDAPEMAALRGPPAV
ncbi:hypothetical protein HCU64_09815 [Methylobacterium sp. C25]|uniref:hypothetical protein n=1 Tax=Methylobacterium sp. C25 TaxID=2721622 RepID=UPI001F1E038F|nr:hypothetical protein [Methylobacterium sp. C25]MCE4224047.1 hypothetical protein [Methylobacterium sp. C25]